MTGIKILTTGMYVPEKVLTNEDFTAMVDTSDEWISSRTGIKRRHISEGEPTWYMGLKAAQDALASAEVSKDEIDLVLVTTVTADYATPSMATIIAEKLGIDHAVCMDINGACTGFIYALDMARRYLNFEDIRNVLIISSETLSKIVDYTDRSTCVLFGDGAGACLVTAAENIYASYLGTDPKGGSSLYARGLENQSPFVKEECVKEHQIFEGAREHYLFMEGREVYRFATKIMPQAIEKACKKIGISVWDLDYIVPHQANIRIVETACTKMKVPADRMYVNVGEYGNTSSASILLCINEMNKKGLLKRGNRIALVGFGAGLTYGSIIMEW